MIKNRKDAITIARELAEATFRKSPMMTEETQDKYTQYIDADLSTLEESKLREYSEGINVVDSRVINTLQCVVALKSCKEYMFKHFVKKATKICKTAGVTQPEIKVAYDLIKK